MSNVEWRFGTGGLSACVRQRGAELSSLRLEGTGELLWQAGPQWPRHAPNLFPIVGKLAGDRLHHDGRSYTLTQHGFARDLDFEWIERYPEACRLRLIADVHTRERYPFDFTLEIAYTITDGALTIDYLVANPSSRPLFASIGAHPAFNWPLSPGTPKTDHQILFDQPEPAPVRRLKAGLLSGEREPSPVEGRVLPLDENLFERDALIFDALASTSLSYGTADLALSVSWEGFEQLGLWMRPGADYLCIEPWHGMASPEGFDGPFTEKPGLFSLKPGEERSFRMKIGPMAQ
ncbi:MAG: aldose 1-epimerase family protein [Parvibaculaceae bacterium]|nr:aldose 1-epimerase family protein [Parvibaculaceae bacterium]